MKKKIGFFVVFALLGSLALAAPAMACKGSHCSMGEGGGWKSGSECSSGKQGGCPIAAKLMEKAHFYLENQKELGLKEDQVQAIKAIKMETKKAQIRQMAEMQVFMLDMHAKLSETKVDTEGINKMIDAMASGMAASGKATVESYAKLKSILTQDQIAKAKEIWTQKATA